MNYMSRLTIGGQRSVPVFRQQRESSRRSGAAEADTETRRDETRRDETRRDGMGHALIRGSWEKNRDGREPQERGRPKTKRRTRRTRLGEGSEKTEAAAGQHQRELDKHRVQGSDQWAFLF
ncbi:UNVERIFIED_CONTAM: hypothetical protein FKN15_001761 [Acipenser sinensis]